MMQEPNISDVVGTETWSNLRDRHLIEKSETRDSKNIVATTKLQFFRISGIFPTCFGCFLSASTADQKHIHLQKFY